MLPFSEWELLGRMALATGLGYAIGFEREWRGKPAGERTFALIALGAAGFTAIGVEAFPASAEKVIAGVVTGVGFLGAGLIFREATGGILGLTTASAAWARWRHNIPSGGRSLDRPILGRPLPPCG